MPGELLLETGALVSLLDRSQTHHLKCRRAFADWTGPVVSTEAVLTEATHLLAGVQGGRAACVDFFLSGGALLVPSSTTSLQRVRKLLDKYADLPMDFADATLVALGRRARLRVRVHHGSDGLFDLPSQRPEALSYRAERLSMYITVFVQTTRSSLLARQPPYENGNAYSRQLTTVRSAFLHLHLQPNRPHDR
jgi:predicted nucleic acid-binding protein